jgi:GIY-YIG catalytic domain
MCRRRNRGVGPRIAPPSSRPALRPVRVILPRVHESTRTLVDPTRVFSRPEILGRPSPVPAVPGVYAWYFAEIPGRADVSQCVRFDDLTLLYVGISPRKPPRTGETTSKMNLRTRIRQHYALNAEGSTLRLTLGRRGRRCYLFSPVDDRGEETPVGVARRPAQLRLAHVDGGRF